MQLSLFDGGTPTHCSTTDDSERRTLADGAWVEYLPGWYAGHTDLMERLIANAPWKHERRRMYERVVDVPRLTATAPTGGTDGVLIAKMAARLGQRYDADLSKVSLAYYRDGNDSVAPHGDKTGPHRKETVIAIVSLGTPRRFTLRRVGGPGSFSYTPGWGDLLVMGGTCQHTWLHGVPKAAGAGPRLSMVFRPASSMH